MITFASDNYASVCPEVMDALAKANHGHMAAYGGDPLTQQATAAIQEALGSPAPLWFVATGTAANTLSLKAVLRSFESVICLDSAHVITHETGAPHHIVGTKFLTCASEDGKITPAQITALYEKESAWGIHATKPRLVTISQTTELGTVYQLDEIAAIRATCDQLGLLLHMDGCRLYNAAAALNCSLADMAQQVDILSLGGTKAGLMFGEAVVFINPDLAPGFEYLQKQGLQLFSKMRYVSAQFLALFTDGLGLKMARECNRLAQILAEGLEKNPETHIETTVDSNMVFVTIPEWLMEPLQAHSHFYAMPGSQTARLVLSHDGSEAHVRDFLARLEQLTAERYASQ